MIILNGDDLMTKNFYTIKDIAAILDITERSARAWANQEGIPSKRIRNKKVLSKAAVDRLLTVDDRETVTV